MGYSFTSTSEKAETFIENISTPVKPYLPAISRFLIVATFFEDGIRILAQWSDQIDYLKSSRHFNYYLATLFLGFNAISMLVFATCIILKKQVGVSVAFLSACIISQAVAYGLIFNIMFFFRNLSVTGGLLLCMSESILRRRSRNNLFASLPQLSDNDKHKYFQLAGRVLLVLLFIGFMFNGNWNWARFIFSSIGLAACGMVVVGFRAKWSATFLVTLLCVVNVLVNNWWDRRHSSFTKDFLRYDFFQCLSIMGGLLLLVSIGPGGFSYDEKKKLY